MTPNMSIATIEDLERILDEYPDIRERIRQKLLTDAERELPQVVEQLAQEVRQLAQAMADGFAQVRAQFELVNARLDALEAGQQKLEASQKRLEDGQNNLRGLAVEQQAAKQLLPRFAQTFGLRRPRVIKSSALNALEQLDDAIDQAESEGRINVGQANAIELADLIVAATSAADRKPLYIVAEIASVVHQDDIQRAWARAAALETATGIATIAVIAGLTIPEHQRRQAAASDVICFDLYWPGNT